MKHSALLKTTAAMGAALTMTCAMATGAFADQVYSISDATISVGQTWSFSYSGYMDWLLSSEYIEHGPNMADTEGVLKYVSTETTGRMTTVTYEAMMPGTCTVTLMDRSFIGGEIDKATVTVTGDGQRPLWTWPRWFPAFRSGAVSAVPVRLSGLPPSRCGA